MPGVGKTLSSRYYSSWDPIETIFPPAHCVKPWPSCDLSKCDTIFYTTPVTSAPSKIEREIRKCRYFFSWLVTDAISAKQEDTERRDTDIDHTKLIIIDEADRLKPACYEQVRDIYDKSNVGVVLIGMPGIEKKLTRYPQLYSRVGFVHNYKPITNEEMEHILQYKWEEILLARALIISLLFHLH